MKTITKRLGLKLDTIVYFGISIATAVISYLYQVYLGNKLSVSNYGIFNTLYAFCVNFSAFFSPIGIFFCCIVAENDGLVAKSRNVIRGIARFGTALSLVISIIAIIMIRGAYSGKFMMSNAEACLLIILAIVSSGYYNVVLAGIQGTSRMIMFGNVTLLNVLLRFILSALGIKINALPEVPVFAFFISNILCGGICYVVLAIQAKKENVDNISVEFDLSRLISFYGKTFVANVIYSFYVNGGELILLSNKYDSKQVGVYSLLITIAKSSIYLVSMLATVMLPKFAKEKQISRESTTKYLLTMAMAFAGGAVWIAFLKYIGICIIPVLFGRGYADVLPYIPYVSIWVIFLGMLCMTNSFYMGTCDLNAYIMVLGGVSAVMILTLRFGNLSFWHMPIVFGVGVGTIEIWSIFDALIKRRRSINEFIEAGE